MERVAILAVVALRHCNNSDSSLRAVIQWQRYLTLHYSPPLAKLKSFGSGEYLACTRSPLSIMLETVICYLEGDGQIYPFASLIAYYFKRPEGRLAPLKQHSKRA